MRRSAEVDFEVGDIAAGASHLAFCNEDVLAVVEQEVFSLHHLASGFLNLGGLFTIGGIGG